MVKEQLYVIESFKLLHSNCLCRLIRGHWRSTQINPRPVQMIKEALWIDGWDGKEWMDGPMQVNIRAAMRMREHTNMRICVTCACRNLHAHVTHIKDIQKGLKWANYWVQNRVIFSVYMRNVLIYANGNAMMACACQKSALGQPQ